MSDDVQGKRTVELRDEGGETIRQVAIDADTDMVLLGDNSPCGVRMFVPTVEGHFVLVTAALRTPSPFKKMPLPTSMQDDAPEPYRVNVRLINHHDGTTTELQINGDHRPQVIHFHKVTYVRVDDETYRTPRQICTVGVLTDATFPA